MNDIKQMTDAELEMLICIARAEAVTMEGDNRIREMDGLPPSWREGAGYPPALTKLYDVLYERGILR